MSTSSVSEPATTRYTRTFVLPWARPPLSLNQRLHHMAKYKRTREIRDWARWTCRDVPAFDFVTVQLTWVVPDRHIRDSENPVPTLKALADGVRDAGVVPDDDPAHMSKPEIQFRYERGVSRLELTITEGRP